MNAFVTVIPILFIRYALLRMLGREALSRAAFFAPLAGKEKTAFWVYQAATLAIAAMLLFLRLQVAAPWFYTGAIVYGLGLALYARSMIDYARPEAGGMNMRGLYRHSRNPMYVAYFLCLMGCVLMTASWLLLMLVLIFQTASHWIVLSEERWCLNRFGDAYSRYMREVRRYI